MTPPLRGKVAVVTGSSRGFGYAAAEALLDAGASVVVSSRSSTAVHKAVENLRAVGDHVAGQPADVTALDAVEALVDYALTTFGGLDIWINNAGIAGPYGPTVELTSETFEQVLGTNVFGVYHGALIAMRHFLRQDSGKLINILGRGARNPTPYQNAYASSKAWVLSFTRALAKEHAESGVSVLAFNPGMMTTDLLTEVSVVAGHERRLAPFATIVRMWAKPPEVPARHLAALVGPQTDGQTGKVIREMNVLEMLWGAVGEGVRHLLGRSADGPEITMNTVPSAFTEYSPQ